ncbi:MAG: membrane dipeptidase, partial [Holdemanella sp.]|nr:membrane dipeptidase [Holdemanella sp.]
KLDENKDYIAPVYKYSDIEDNERKGKISSLLTLEDGGVVFNSLAMLRNYYRMGVRMIALTWNYENGIGYPNISMSKMDDFSIPNPLQQVDEIHGLTPFGIEYVKEMEKLGMIIDVSHLSDAGFYDVLKYTSKPFVASHSNARSVCNVARNLSDDMIIKLAQRKGVMGLNFCGDFLEEHDKPNGISRIEAMVKHIKYIKELAGIDVIGLGTDFDGISCELEIKDASYMHLLEKALYEEGFSKEEVEKIFYKNVLRVYKEVLK